MPSSGNRFSDGELQTSQSLLDTSMTDIKRMHVATGSPFMRFVIRERKDFDEEMEGKAENVKRMRTNISRLQKDNAQFHLEKNDLRYKLLQAQGKVSIMAKTLRAMDAIVNSIVAMVQEAQVHAKLVSKVKPYLY